MSKTEDPFAMSGGLEADPFSADSSNDPFNMDNPFASPAVGHESASNADPFGASICPFKIEGSCDIAAANSRTQLLDEVDPFRTMAIHASAIPEDVDPFGTKTTRKNAVQEDIDPFGGETICANRMSEDADPFGATSMHAHTNPEDADPFGAKPSFARFGAKSGPNRANMDHTGMFAANPLPAPCSKLLSLPISPPIVSLTVVDPSSISTAKLHHGSVEFPSSSSTSNPCASNDTSTLLEAADPFKSIMGLSMPPMTPKRRASLAADPFAGMGLPLLGPTGGQTIGGKTIGGQTIEGHTIGGFPLSGPNPKTDLSLPPSDPVMTHAQVWVGSPGYIQTSPAINNSSMSLVSDSFEGLLSREASQQERLQLG